jgi:hypothetical protein
MGRLRRFPDYRIVGRRDQMVAFDCDDDAQFALLQGAVDETALDMKNLLQAFAPDTLEEARNRGFRPVRATLADD